MEVIRYPGQVAKVVSCVWTGILSWREELATLEQVDGENEDLVTGKNLTRAISAAEAERNQSLILDKPMNRFEHFNHFKAFVFTFHPLTKIWLDQICEDL